MLSAAVEKWDLRKSILSEKESFLNIIIFSYRNVLSDEKEGFYQEV